MRFEKNTTLEKRQALLDKILKKTMEELRLKCFKYKRRQFLWSKVIIKERDLTELNANGLYETSDKDKDYRYTHNIYINTELLDNYFNYKRKYGWYSKYFTKKWHKKQIKDTIFHELCHAFVYEQFEDWCDIPGTNRDASPIFLATLNFLGGTSSHHAAIYFVDTQLYKDIKQIADFKDFSKYIIKLIHKYNKATRDLTKMYNIKEDKKLGTVTENTFSFAHRSMGLRADYLSTSNFYSKDKKLNVFLCGFSIGSTIEPEQIESLVNKKLANENFKIVAKDKNYYVNANKSINVKIS